MTDEFIGTAALGLPVIGFLLGLMVWLRAKRHRRRRHFLSLPEIGLAELRPDPKEGLLRIRARTDEPIEAPIGGTSAAVTVCTFATGYKGAMPLIHRASEVTDWRTKKGTRVRFRGQVEVVSSAPLMEHDVDHERLELPQSIDVGPGRYHLAERAVEVAAWVHVLCRCHKDEDGIALSPLVEGSPILLLPEGPDAVARQIVNPGVRVRLAGRVDLATLAEVLERHEKESFIKRRASAR